MPQTSLRMAISVSVESVDGKINLKQLGCAVGAAAIGSIAMVAKC